MKKLMFISVLAVFTTSCSLTSNSGSSPCWGWNNAYSEQNERAQKELLAKEEQKSIKKKRLYSSIIFCYFRILTA